MQNKSVQQAIIAGAALGFFIVVAAVLYVEKNKIMPAVAPTGEKTPPAAQNKIENKITEIVETDSNSDWRLFGSKNYQYQVRYPADLKFWIPTEEKFLSGPILQKLDWRKNIESFINLEVYPKDYDIYADDLEKNLPYQNLTINGQKAVRLDGKTENNSYSSETTIYGPKFTYQIIFNEQGGKTIEPVYDQIISTFVLNENIAADKINYWELVSGNPTDTCSGPTYSGEAIVHGWYEWDYVYVEKSWVLRISSEDAKKLPIKEILGGTAFYDEFMKKPALVLTDAPAKLQAELKQASLENPVELKLQGFKMYCEGAPMVSLNPKN